MKTRFALVLVCTIPACSFGQASNFISISALRHEAEVASAYSSAGIKHLMLTARTEEEFGEIAAYFDRQAEIDAAHYEDEQKDLNRLVALSYHSKAYPEQVENTRNRIEHFKALSEKCSAQAELYHAREKGAATVASAAPPAQ